jgi:hypothetical protein
MIQDMRLVSPTTLQRAKPGRILTLHIQKQLKTVKSPGKVMATLLRHVYGVLLVGFLQLASAINTFA